jgi:hypothetical protein
MKKVIVLFLAIVILLSPIHEVSAHSGRTDSSGGHNCNVGACAGTYHYHNGGYTPPAQVYYAPTVVPTNTPMPTFAPTATPTPTAVPTNTPTPTPTVVPTVAESVSEEPKVQESESNKEGFWRGLIRFLFGR